MSQLTIKHLEGYLARPESLYAGYAYVETGRYKPYNGSTVKAAERRGYRVEKLAREVYAIYPKCAHVSGNVVTCGTCGNSWCAACDPCPAALCHWCHGRGHSTAQRTKP